MTHCDRYFEKINNRHPSIVQDLIEVFRSEGSTSPQRSINLLQIRLAYLDITGEDFPVKGGTRVQMSFILTVPYVCCFSNAAGTLRFYLMVEPKQ
ncbi:uncharacterized protein LOC124461629 [Drosophila willistoni]|uniref:uncharacterized protein LOC124461629 n=1 Tax=Drosophila willistoni TaxID=7260 RepID=UPI001F07320C|nr:uncharacterized protein LOC124461629 [Drosophila willistoni]